MIYLAISPEIYPFLMICLPWFWVTIRGYRDGGFSVDIQEPPKNGPPDQIAYIEFYPDEIRGQYWRIPNTPYKWKQEIIWAWEEIVEHFRCFGD